MAEKSQLCSKLRIKIMGDMPIYVGHHSADVWANQRSFMLDRVASQFLLVVFPVMHLVKLVSYGAGAEVSSDSRRDECLVGIDSCSRLFWCQNCHTEAGHLRSRKFC